MVIKGVINNLFAIGLCISLPMDGWVDSSSLVPVPTTDSSCTRWSDNPQRQETTVRDRVHKVARRSRSALVITETELALIARAANIGLSRIPNAGYNTPAAMGTPAVL